MTRVKRGNVARRRRNKILKIAKGFRGSSSTLFRTANQRALKALSASHRDRLQRRRDFRSLWITRINAAVRLQGIKYSDFFFSLRKSNMCLNRKVLAQLASRDEKAFQRLVDLIKDAVDSSIQYPFLRRFERELFFSSKRMVGETFASSKVALC